MSRQAKAGIVRSAHDLDAAVPKQGRPKHAYDDAVLTWKAPEYTYHEKSIIWFILAGFVALLLVIYGILTNGWTFSVAILVFAGTYYLVYREKPKMVEIKISRFGVKVGHHIFPYNHLKSFWIVYNLPFVKRLYLRFTSRLHPDIAISLEDMDAAQIRRVLADHLQELKGTHEPFSDALVRVFKL
ncbi:MAG: hypothetical protein AAB606_05655 [Patescibacteria group bacterium]